LDLRLLFLDRSGGHRPHALGARSD
jgi:hypothetical protein